MSLAEIGTGIIGRAVTRTLYVSPLGTNRGGFNWANAYTAIETALDAASTNAYDCTLILISPHTSNYDINRTGDPTWAGNYILMGTQRKWTIIMNSHVTATSIMKFTGKVALYELDFNLGTAKNGVICTGSGARGYHVEFVGSDLVSPATALNLVGGVNLTDARFEDIFFKGQAANMTALKLDKSSFGQFLNMRIHNSFVGIHIINAVSDENFFRSVDIGECATGIKIDAGNEQHFIDMLLHHNTVNVTDAVGDSLWQDINVESPTVIHPSDLIGIPVACGNGAWGLDTELRTAVAATKPFKIVAYTLRPSNDEVTLIRFSADSGVSFFTEDVFSGARNKATGGDISTDYIFNKGTRSSASAWSPGAGRTIDVWLEVLTI